MSAGLESGVVTEWHEDEGWGVVKTETDGIDCWAHFSAHRGGEYFSPNPGTRVSVIKDNFPQDGYEFRIIEMETVADN